MWIGNFFIRFKRFPNPIHRYMYHIATLWTRFDKWNWIEVAERKPNESKIMNDIWGFFSEIIPWFHVAEIYSFQANQLIYTTKMKWNPQYSTNENALTFG